MIRRGTQINVLDNSTISRVKCLTVIRRLSSGHLADIILSVVKREFFRKRTFRKRFFFALIINLKRPVFRPAGSYYVRFPRNGVLLLKEDRESLVGTRFYARVPLEIRSSRYNEICQYTRKTF